MTAETYDYVVIGAGSAGCVVARRLCEDRKYRVLLLEAGGKAEGFWNRTPAGAGRLQKSREFNWSYVTEPVPALGNRKLPWPAGRGLGGSSGINGMVYVRGDRRDFDHWAQLGNPGWAWDDVLPYFRRSEANGRGASDIHGSDGPFAVSDPAVLHPTVHDFVEAAGRCGLPRRDDFSAGDVDGAGPVQYSIRNGVRETSYNAFVKPVRHLPNLTVETGAQVCRILIADGAATGVEFRQEGQLRTVLATREVILSAGAMRSPHILMLSGIGDGAASRQMGVTPLAHLPGVGRNLQDHYMVRVQAETTPGSSYNRELRGWRKYLQGARYLLTHGGYLALGTSSAAAFLKSSDAVDYPDIEISFRPMTFSFTAAGDAQADTFDAISGSVYRVRPASRGEIRLHSPDPMDPPIIQPNYMSAPEDVTATIAGVRGFRRILKASPLASHVRRELLPGDSLQSDDELRDHVIEAGGSVFHPAGSCRMGNDELAVVDHRLRLRGVARLRVVDASIMPVVTSGNTNAPTIMIGEKGAAMIRADAV